MSEWPVYSYLHEGEGGLKLTGARLHIHVIPPTQCLKHKPDLVAVQPYPDNTHKWQEMLERLENMDREVGFVNIQSATPNTDFETQAASRKHSEITPGGAQGIQSS